MTGAARAGLVLHAACTVFTAGCATVTGSEGQSIAVEAVNLDGVAVESAECKLDNDKGSWTVKPPAFVTVRRSGQDLTVQCTADYHDAGLAKAVSRANGSMYGNILVGGVVGAVVDNQTGHGYDYPDKILVVFGTHRVFDRAQTAGGTPTTPGPATPSASPPAAVPPRSGGSTTLDDLKDLLPPAGR